MSAYDLVHAIASALHTEPPRLLRAYVRDNAEYYCKHMSEDEFAAAAYYRFTGAPASAVIRAHGRVAGGRSLDLAGRCECWPLLRNLTQSGWSSSCVRGCYSSGS